MIVRLFQVEIFCFDEYFSLDFGIPFCFLIQAIFLSHRNLLYIFFFIVKARIIWSSSILNIFFCFHPDCWYILSFLIHDLFLSRSLKLIIHYRFELFLKLLANLIFSWHYGPKHFSFHFPNFSPLIIRRFFVFPQDFAVFILQQFYFHFLHSIEYSYLLPVQLFYNTYLFDFREKKEIKGK